MKIVIKSFNGIGDLLFVTPTLRVIKEAYPDSVITINTNRRELLKDNPFVDIVGGKNEGVFLKYPAPDGGVLPHQHHILSDWEIVCKEYNLITKKPVLRPELFLKCLPQERNLIGVQTHHKRIYHNKRVWSGLEELSAQEGFEPIPWVKGEEALVRQIASYKCVVCPEGGVSHIAAALRQPAIVLMGGFTSPEWVGYDFHINITSNIECKYCYNNNPCKNKFKCWDEVSIEQIKRLVL